MFVYLSFHSLEFARLLSHLIRLRACYLHYPIKKICLENASDFTLQAFNKYCMSLGIDVEHTIAHV